jgi:hypothetical protein
MFDAVMEPSHSSSYVSEDCADETDDIDWVQPNLAATCTNVVAGKFTTLHQGSLYHLTDDDCYHPEQQYDGFQSCSNRDHNFSSQNVNESCDRNSTGTKVATSNSFGDMAIFGLTILVPMESQKATSLSYQDHDHPTSRVNSTHVLRFTRNDCEFAQRLFAILDFDNRGYLDYPTLEEFVRLRCPTLWRRDDEVNMAIASANLDHCSFPVPSRTFDEIWQALIDCCPHSSSSRTSSSFLRQSYRLGIEGLLVFCRFLSFAQYQEAKRQFASRHRQQTVSNRSLLHGSEVIVVEVPPQEPPNPISPRALLAHDVEQSLPLPLPELDLDHSQMAAHDCRMQGRDVQASRGSIRCGRSTCRTCHRSEGHVRVTVFGEPYSVSSSTSVEFALTFYPNSSHILGATKLCEVSTVRRTLSDLQWLDETFTSHRILGGTLCGRILPTFPGTSHSHHSTISSTSSVAASIFSTAASAAALGTGAQPSTMPHDSASVLLPSSLRATGGAAMAVAAAGVLRIRHVARSLFSESQTMRTSISASDLPLGSNLSLDFLPSRRSGGMKLTNGGKRSSIQRLAIPESYYNPNSPSGKARQIERYLNFLLVHPAMSSSFPLSIILKVS